ncbi:hypothetical protein B0H12DRAFT_1323432 [Mycena haematopus]|nr:hypothetical protein B0H12DRAFT_1323432 [Mycena haematopus]
MENQTETELKKLTVPQLKALCKERRISGYSKLAKDAIIAIILLTASSSAEPTAAQTSVSDNGANPAASSDHAPSPSKSAPNTFVPACADGEPVPKALPKKRKNPAASQSQPDTRVCSTSTAPSLNPADAADAEPVPKPRPKKKKNPLTPQPPSDPSTPTALPPNPTPTASTSTFAQPSPPPLDSSIPARANAEPVTKPRPEKRKNLPSSGSQSSPDHVFKVPALPQRLTQDSASTPVPTVPIASTPASGPTSAMTTSSASAAASKKRKTTANKQPTSSTPDSDVVTPSTVPKKRKTVPHTGSVPSAAEAATLPTASSSIFTGSKKRKAVSPPDFTPSAAESATHNTFAPPTASSTRSDSPVSADPGLPAADPNIQNIPGVSDHSAKVPKRAGPTTTDQPPPKKQKIASLLPTSKPSAVSILVHQTAAPPFPSVVPVPQAKLPQAKAKRFVPLVVARKPLVTVTAAPPPPISTAVPILGDASVIEILYHLDFPTAPPPPALTSITLPPKKSERKHVPRLSLLLSSVADEDISNCISVSRVFRYAMYLSAVNRLLRDFAGKRLSSVLAKYPQATTNMWPYLRQRRQEVSTRQREYRMSFLSRVFPASGTKSPISKRLWTSPDHERQIVIALRFLLARLFFSVSVGGGREGKGWDEGQIVDAQELVKGEVWTITVQHSATSTESFYVLEPTCEPLTAGPNSGSSTGVPVRMDWSAYIAHRASSSQKSPAPRLLDCLSWTNHEEYQLGISRLWLRRIEGEDETGRMKRVVAERYILACVVANSLSGRYMSATQMAQDFAGLSDVAPARPILSPKVNLFLPAHHHVESVHFTTSGRALHGALAIVQTPGRIYFILRDNGMQIGCEEEGVAEVWMNLLSCNNSGVALQR